MRELSLHVLDVVENAMEAGVLHIDLRIVEDLDADCLTITVRDDGCGMDAETVQKVRDPFFTTRTARHVGLGIPLFAAAVERCGGALTVESSPGKGTTVTATFQHSHLDRAPLGDMTSTLMGILMRGATGGAQDFDLHYVHRVSGANMSAATFEFDTVEIKRELGSLPLSYPEVRRWLGEFIAQGEQSLRVMQERRGAGAGKRDVCANGLRPTQLMPT
jgi:anti-sigma regulatory factor (Ser/Thr protein kinase)